ncbi:DUF4150 domain-containing protein [Vibrio gazogenes]|uniref:Uncharacterized protein n=1 Tax=Vibrio gazogenes DSM 21264 = NBRC 103151 TaxID=1123492 RepID=A0A1M4TH75_VIBGA|nr:DUF4150 domain-containing protein [Vibrio gazogenes]USP16096.1 DUF4150 domain-containing protein [Vibrio gazogenes]SHE43820.1 protein of unknown function [Vibrio gazogenes DSM 21264] [Vibrio gazogenes DSM 21264 = NBRC 103151]SJN54222.1 hypothetical protein BQ6471_00886 [Vibrio gazogenes]
MFANTQNTAMHMGMPDVCKTQVALAVVPIPYPNIAMTDMAVPNVDNVLIEVMPVHNLMTMVEMSNGDEAGIEMGIVSSLIMGPVKHELGSLKVIFMAAPATTMTAVTGQNGTEPNAPGLTLTPSQVKVIING